MAGARLEGSRENNVTSTTSRQRTCVHVFSGAWTQPDAGLYQYRSSDAPAVPGTSSGTPPHINPSQFSTHATTVSCGKPPTKQTVADFAQPHAQRRQAHLKYTQPRTAARHTSEALQHSGSHRSRCAVCCAACCATLIAMCGC